MMVLSAWETVWLCVASTVCVMALDHWLANRAGPQKLEVQRQQGRAQRAARLQAGQTQEGDNP
ncbi:MAG TPA: hypothetical protein VFV39_09220 [Limnobacter sp.]|nr:hypothetical protein [Limnobacter sp.]